MENNIFRHKLSNELEIMAIEKPNTSLFLIEMIVKVGSSVLFQNKDEIECAHFLEHFNARFTSTKYPDYKENIHKFDFNGITYNASTSDEETYIYIYGCFYFSGSMETDNSTNNFGYHFANHFVDNDGDNFASRFTSL